jgi:DNA-binding GntR family transcriptional regulator
MPRHPVAGTAVDTAVEIATAVARRDPQRLAEALTETVRLRALLPGGPVEVHGRTDVAARFHAWFADFSTVEVVESTGEQVADKLLIHYRLHLTQATTRWVCTQTAVCKVADGGLAVIDLLCSGFREVRDDEFDDEDLPASSGAGLVG